MSAPINNVPPIKLANHINQPWVDLTTERTRCGAASPTNAISPVCATAVLGGGYLLWLMHRNSASGRSI